MIENWLWCAYEDCEYGDTYDAVEWHVIRKNYPNVPETPERDVCYIPDKLMTEEYLAERAKRGSREKYEAMLAKVPDVEPEEYDRLD
jgi:hypothetical protein